MPAKEIIKKNYVLSMCEHLQYISPEVSLCCLLCLDSTFIKTISTLNQLDIISSVNK